MVAGGKAILLAESDVNFRNMLSLELRRRGYSVIPASGGEKAFELAQKSRVDLVIACVEMSGGDGLDLLRKLQAAKISSPIILISGDPEMGEKTAAGLGAAGFFLKPFSPSVMLDKISALMATSSHF